MSDPSAAAVEMDPATIVALWYELEDAIGKVQLYFAALWLVSCIILSSFHRGRLKTHPLSSIAVSSFTSLSSTFLESIN